MSIPPFSSPTRQASFTASGKVKQTIYNVRDFGAVGDGVTDDLVAIRATITAAGMTGGRVFFPPAIFAISSYLDIPSSVWLVGAGKNSIIKLLAGSNIDNIIRGTAVSYSGLSELSVDYNHQNNPSCNSGMSFGSACSYITVEDCVFKNCKGFAVGFTGTPTVRNNHVVTSRNVITNPLSSNNDMFLVVSDYGLVADNRVVGCTDNVSIFLYESDHLTAYGNIVELASGSGERPSGIFLGSMRWGNVYGNQVIGAGTSNATAYSIITEHDNASPTLSKDNLFYGNYSYNVQYGIAFAETTDDLAFLNRFDTVARAFYFPQSPYANSTNTLLVDNYLGTVTTPIYDTTTAPVATYTVRDTIGYTSPDDTVKLSGTQTVTGLKTYSSLLSTAAINAAGTISTTVPTGNYFGRSNALGDATLTLTRSSGEGDPAVIGGTVALFQSNSTSGFSATAGIIAGTAGSAVFTFGDKDAQGAGSISWNNVTNAFTVSGGNFGVGNAPTAIIDAGAATTNNASLRIRSGTAPTSPNSGDVWFDGSHLQFRNGSTTNQIDNQGGGTVTTASIVSANGLAGTVANPTTTPAITLSTTVTGLLKGNGTAISAATAGTDYITPTKLFVTTGSNAAAGTGTLTGGTATISTTAVTANSLIFLQDTAGTITNVGTLTVSAKSAGTSFTVTSTLALDTSTFNWLILN